MKQSSEEKFFNQNSDIFLRYFESPQQYQALILAGSWDKMHQIIRQNTSFDLQAWGENHLAKGDLAGFKREINKF